MRNQGGWVSTPPARVPVRSGEYIISSATLTKPKPKPKPKP